MGSARCGRRGSTGRRGRRRSRAGAATRRRARSRCGPRPGAGGSCGRRGPRGDSTAAARLQPRYSPIQPAACCGSVRAVAATRSIDLRTEIPGARSREILARKERVVAEPLSIYLPVVIQEGRGALVTDVDGNTFLDFTGGGRCLNVGPPPPPGAAAAPEEAPRVRPPPLPHVAP